MALNGEAEIAELIVQTTATRNPFDRKYSKVEDADWETCSSVLNPICVRQLMETGWWQYVRSLFSMPWADDLLRCLIYETHRISLTQSYVHKCC